GLPETGAARARRARERAEMVRSRLRDASLPAPRPSPARTFSSNLGAATYVEAGRGILRRMEAGEVEQANLAHRLPAPCGPAPRGDPRALRRLRHERRAHAGERLARALLPAAQRPGGMPADQGYAPPRPRRGGGPAAGRGALGEREGAAGEPDGRRAPDGRA